MKFIFDKKKKKNFWNKIVLSDFMCIDPLGPQGSQSGRNEALLVINDRYSKLNFKNHLLKLSLLLCFSTY